MGESGLAIPGLRHRRKLLVGESSPALIVYAVLAGMLMVGAGVVAHGILHWPWSPFRSLASEENLGGAVFVYVGVFMLAAGNGLWIFARCGLRSVAAAYAINFMWAVIFVWTCGSFFPEVFGIRYPAGFGAEIPGRALFLLAAGLLAVVGFGMNCWVCMNPAFARPRGQKAHQEFLYFLPDSGRRVLTALEEGDAATLAACRMKEPVTAETTPDPSVKWALRIAEGFAHRKPHLYAMLLLVSYPGRIEYPQLLTLRDVSASTGYDPHFFFAESGETCLNCVPLTASEVEKLKRMLPDGTRIREGGEPGDRVGRAESDENRHVWAGPVGYG